jgi:hypothetical protein
MSETKHQHIPISNCCESSQVKGYGYDADSKTLAVEFKSGGVYHYRGVPLETYGAMQKAESVGKFIGANIKGSFEFSKIGAEA